MMPDEPTSREIEQVRILLSARSTRADYKARLARVALTMLDNGYARLVKTGANQTGEG